MKMLTDSDPLIQIPQESHRLMQSTKIHKDKHRFTPSHADSNRFTQIRRDSHRFVHVDTDT